MILLLAGLVLAACGGSSSSETATETAETADSGEIVDEAAEAEAASTAEDDDSIAVVATTAPETDEAVDDPESLEDAAEASDADPDAAVDTDTDAVESGDADEQEAFVLPDAGPGLGAFALQAFQTGELGLDETEQGCIDGRLQSELRIDRGVLFDTLEIDEQATSIEILLDCAGPRLEAEFLSEIDFGNDAIFQGQDEEIGRCIYRGLSRDDDDQPAVILAIAHFTAGESAPPETIEPAAAVFANCFDLGELLVQQFTADPEMASFIDADCILEVVDEDVTASIFATYFADVDAAESATVPDSFSVVSTCTRFGTLIAEQFAGAVTLSNEEITCIDEAFQDEEIFIAVANGGDLPPAAIEVMTGCFSLESLQALGG